MVRQFRKRVSVGHAAGPLDLFIARRALVADLRALAAALEALVAIAVRSFGVSAFARALPPRRPSSTAIGSFAMRMGPQQI
jgi:hypothetical protein